MVGESTSDLVRNNLSSELVPNKEGMHSLPHREP